MSDRGSLALVVVLLSAAFICSLGAAFFAMQPPVVLPADVRTWGMAALAALSLGLTLVAVARMFRPAGGSR
ncbi:MAG TPA: hypothetical protein VM840_07740 [Actinomycetota bacterium]|nr:hypothetical protein [Actinomycetota bacterium]